MSKELHIGLNKLQFIINDKFDDGLFLVSEIEKHKDNPSVYFALEKAKKYQNIFAVYFRIFSDNRPYLPQIYIFDYTNEHFEEQNFSKEIHKRVWSSTQVPLIYVFTKLEILIFNSHSPELTISENFGLYQKLVLADEINEKISEKNAELIKDFSTGSFANGSFWDKEKYRSDFVVSRNVYEKLISKLGQIRKELIKSPDIFLEKIDENKRIDIIHKLLIMSILLKYLEEKRDTNGNKVFPDNFFGYYSTNAKSFVDILYHNGDLLGLFDELSKHFNGEVFKLEKTEKQLIKKINLTKFAEFFEGTTENDRQRTFWRLYSFDDLPVELISNIYENFLNIDKEEKKIKKEKSEKEKSGIVYTPPYLVNFLLEELIPLNSTETETNVKILDPSCGSGIFLVQAYKRLIQRWKIKNNWQKPDLKILKDLLIQNIYGVDIKRDAVRLTAFSLTLALCDELNPIQIWTELKFDKLKDNLFEGDFFLQIANKTLPKEFDIIVGNPPFIDDLTDSAKGIENKRIERGLPVLPEYYSLSFLFLEQTAKLLSKQGNICLLFPSDSILTRNSEFKKYFFRKFNIKYLVDFTALRRKLFKSASVAVVAVFYNKHIEIQDNILHIVVRRTRTSHSELFFELDKYDFHSIDKEESLKYPYVWKANLFGVSRRIFELVKKLDKLPKLNNLKQLGTVSEKKVSDYPKLIIKKNLGLYFLKNQIIENKSIADNDFAAESMSIFSNSNDSLILRQIKENIDNGKLLFKFFILNTSDRAAINRSFSTITTNDIYNIPYVENIDNKLSEIEKLLVKECNDQWLDFFRFGEKSKILKAIELENDINPFSETYLEILNSVYKTYKAAQPIINANSIIFPFYWGDNSRIPNKENLDATLQRLLSIDNHHANVRYIRVMRLYDENVIYLIKPNQIRYWLPSVAVRDADDTFEYLVKQEYSV